jgi:hypothetical protein
MITGFNPADMYGVDHIRRVLRDVPGVFTGIGEFSIHKEFVSAKISGETASLTIPALDPRLELRARTPGWSCSSTATSTCRSAKHDAEPVYLEQMKALLAAPSEGLDHLGAHRLGRVVSPTAGTAGITARAPSHHRHHRVAAADPRCARQLRPLVGRGREIRRRDTRIDREDRGAAQQVSRSLPVRHRHRRARRPGAVLRGVRHVGAGLAGADAVRQPAIRKGNYERIFDEGRRRVRAWELANVP